LGFEYRPALPLVLLPPVVVAGPLTALGLPVPVVPVLPGAAAPPVDAPPDAVPPDAPPPAALPPAPALMATPEPATAIANASATILVNMSGLQSVAAERRTDAGPSAFPASGNIMPRTTNDRVRGGSIPNRDSPDGSRTGVNIRVFPAFLEDRSEVRTATVNSGSPNGGRGADLAIFAGIFGPTPPIGSC
jgi:hypothetical protein